MVIKLKKLLITLAVTMHGPLTAGAAQAEQVVALVAQLHLAFFALVVEEVAVQLKK